VCVDVKYLPTIVEEGVCFSTMGTRHIKEWCSHSLAPPSPLCGYDYHEVPSKIYYSISNLVNGEKSVNVIRLKIAREFRVLISPDHISMYVRNYKKLCENLQWFDDNCRCSTWLTRDRYCSCKHVRIHFVKLYIEDVFDDLKV
jgi:hypothetical protein